MIQNSIKRLPAEDTTKVSPNLHVIFIFLFFSLGSLSAEESCKSTIFKSGQENGISSQLRYGNIYLLPSLIGNSSLEYDKSKKYSTVQLMWQTSITPSLIYSGALELTNRPHELIGTKFSRPDYVLSTGRFQESKIDYQSKSLRVEFGRANFFEEDYLPIIFKHPVNGDGLSLVYQWERLAFKYVLQSLPAENSDGVIFRRLMTYHHLEYRFGQVLVGAGELFILTGENLGLELKRLNPLLPFSLNSHDSEQEVFDGFSGDSDNALIKFFVNWKGNQSRFNIRLFIDEFQIDSEDRETNSDGLLLSISGEYDFNSILGIGVPGTIEGIASFSSPNFGDHPGPFTSTTSASFPLFEYSPGMLNLIYLKAELHPTAKSQMIIAAHQERWVQISSLSPEDRNQKLALEGLLVKRDNRVVLAYRQEAPKLNSIFHLQSWWDTPNENGLGISLSLILFHRL
jgi:hypothetical protein